MKLVDDLRSWIAKARREGSPAKPVAGPTFGLDTVDEFLRDFDRLRESERSARTMLGTVMMGVVAMTQDRPDPALRAKMPEGHLRYYLRFHTGYECVLHIIPATDAAGDTLRGYYVRFGSLLDERDGAMREHNVLHSPPVSVVLHTLVEGYTYTHGPCLECVEGDGPTRAELLAEVERLRAEATAPENTPG